MTKPDTDRDDVPDSDRVLIAAPFRRDAALIQELLLKYRIVGVACNDPIDLARELAVSGATLVMSQEALTTERLDVVAGHLAAQPTWSELPLILLLDEDQQNSAVLARLRERLLNSKLAILQRPVRTLELATAVQTAVAARRRQLQLRDHLAWQEELRHELNHRVKNVLATVMAIYHMTLRQNTSLPDFTASFEGRLLALSGVHSALTASAKPRALVDIAKLVLAPYRSAAVERIVIDGPLIELTPQSAVTLALCLHELATNAAKYGALSVPQGTVSLTWALEHIESRLLVRVSWTERGGPPTEVPSRRGYGTSFIRSAIKGLSGTIDFQFPREGLICLIVAPAERLREAIASKETTTP